MENSNIELIFPIFFIFIFIFASINQKMAYKMSQRMSPQFFMKIPYTVFIPINARDVYLKIWLFRGALIQEGHLIERGVYLQIRSIVDMFFSFNTWQAIEKTTNLHYHLFICFILDHIHFLLASSSSEGEMNGLTASLSSTKIELGGQLLPSSFARLFLF